VTARAPLPDGTSSAEIAASARELGVALDSAQCERLLLFAGLLLRWNRVHNLTAIERPDQIVTHHLLDSLAVVPVLDELARGRALRVLDVGAGGGLPGVPLAIAMPRHHFTLIDKAGKKAAFLQQARVELALENVEAVHARVEDLNAPAFDVIVSRAFSSLADFVGLTRGLIAADGVWCAMKGAVPTAEIEELAQTVRGVRLTRTVRLHVPRLHAERHLLLIEPN
jgi:16S rRNA (guanine527-N7)-methyltransferase